MSTPAEPTGVWDQGLQLERTTLAWRRAAIAFLGLGLAVPRVAWGVLGAWSILPATLIVAGAGVLLASGHRRYGHSHRALTTRLPLPDGRLLALGATLAVLVGGLGLLLALSPQVEWTPIPQR